MAKSVYEWWYESAELQSSITDYAYADRLVINLTAAAERLVRDIAPKLTKVHMEPLDMDRLETCNCCPVRLSSDSFTTEIDLEIIGRSSVLSHNGDFIDEILLGTPEEEYIPSFISRS